MESKSPWEAYEEKFIKPHCGKLDIALDEYIPYDDPDRVDFRRCIREMFAIFIDELYDKGRFDKYEDRIDPDELFEKLNMLLDEDDPHVNDVHAFNTCFISGTRAFNDINDGIPTEGRNFFGLTIPRNNNTVEVLISTTVDGLSKQQQYQVIGHEVAHVMDFYINGHLDHGPTWKECADTITSLFKKLDISEEATKYFEA